MVRKIGTAGPDTINGTAGADQLYSMAGNDLVRGLGGDDQIAGAGGNDRLFGDAGRDRINGDKGADVLDGGADNDKLWGGVGRDTLYGRDGADFIWGGRFVGLDDLGDSDPDRMFGGSGNDWMFSQDHSRDMLWGEAGQDLFYVSNDVVFGGAGLDSISALTEDDAPIRNDLTLGAGNDEVFVHMLAGGDTDTIVRDWTGADKLQLAIDGISARTDLDRNGDGAVNSVDNGSFTAGGVEVTIAFDAAGGTLAFNGNSLELVGAAAINADQWW